MFKDKMQIENKRVLVAGLGRSGIAAAELLVRNGAKVTAVDSAPESSLKGDLNILRNIGVEIFTGEENSQHRLDRTDLLVISPGVPLASPLPAAAVKNGVEVIGELELGFQFCQAEIIAVTGTNGKSTTTSLIGAILDAANIPNIVAGNIGKAFCSFLPTEAKYAVVEVSSYQLETIKTFKPRVAVWLNLTPDHLARHRTMEGYAEAKARIFRNQGPDDVFVYNRDDKIVNNMSELAPGKKLSFTFRHSWGVYAKDYVMRYKWENKNGTIIPTSDIKIKGKHNLENSLAAAGAALAVGVPPKAIADALRKFPGIEHRQEFTAEIAGVKYINDSKATNLDSTLKALITVRAPIILIAGGRGKGESYTPAKELAKSKVKLIITLGEMAEQIEKELSPYSETMRARDMAEAVTIAARIGKPGDNVLLSPMCASFDMFDDFEHRGRVFKELVMKLK